MKLTNDEKAKLYVAVAVLIHHDETRLAERLVEFIRQG